MRTMSLDPVGVIRNDNAPFIPSDPVEIRDSTLHVQATAIRPVGLPNRAAPVADAGDSDGKKARLVGRTMIGKLPEGEGLELAFGNDNRDVTQDVLRSPRRQVQELGATRRAEVFLPRLQTACGVVLHLGVIVPRAILAHIISAWPEIRNDDAGIVAAFSPYDVQRIDSAQPRAVSHFAVDPAFLQGRVVGWSQARTNRPRAPLLPCDTPTNCVTPSALSSCLSEPWWGGGVDFH